MKITTLSDPSEGVELRRPRFFDISPAIHSSGEVSVNKSLGDAHILSSSVPAKHMRSALSGGQDRRVCSTRISDRSRPSPRSDGWDANGTKCQARSGVCGAGRQ